MGDSENADIVYDPLTESVSWMRGVFSTVRSTVQGRPSQKPDPELGVGDILARAAAFQSGYPRFARFLNRDEDFMIYRRFASLHIVVLLYQQEDLICLEEDLMRLEREDLFQKHRQSSASNNDMAKLLEEIEKKLSTYKSMILSMKSLKHNLKPSLCQYRSVRDYLRHGPPIYMSDSEIRDKQWARYKTAVKDFLNDPKTAPWLDGPFHLDWSEGRCYQLYERDQKEGDGTTWISRLKRKFVHTVAVGSVLFWISHITSALGFLLLTNTSGDDGHPMAEMLLGYWYFSAVSIFLPELLSKGYVYARKVFLGGMLACVGGFYTLNTSLGISTESALTAIPTFFTIVLLLIRTM